MLHLVSHALVELIWPLKWAGVFIPVLPSRLVQALEAPCPYICGIERRYENVELPQDDFVLVDLDNNEIESTASPTPIPRQQRRKLMSLLQLAAPHHYKFGVSPGPPAYAVESFPRDSFASANTSIFSSNAQSTSLAKLVGLTSTSFGAQAAADGPRKGLILNAFLQSYNTRSRGTTDRPVSSSASRTSNHGTPQGSPVASSFPPLPVTPVSRNDSGYALQASLREKRSGHFDSFSKRSGSVRKHVTRKPSIPFVGHSSNSSLAAMNPDLHGGTSTYAPSTYAQSTIAASTIMPGVLMQPVRNTESTSWVEGHCLEWRPKDDRATCSVCDEKAEDKFYRCSGCGTVVHGRCAAQLYIVCPSAFYPEQIRAAFVRCFASLFYTYRKYMGAPTPDQKKNGMFYCFNMNDFLRSLPRENAEYLVVLQQTQGELFQVPNLVDSQADTLLAFNEFIAERERTSTSTIPAYTASPSTHTSIALFDSIIISKRNRGRLRTPIPTLTLNRNPFSTLLNSASAAAPDFLCDTSEHLWRTASASNTSDRENYRTDFGDGRDYRTIVRRVPAKLEDVLMREPRMIQGVPRISEKSRQSVGSRKALPLREKMNGLGMHAPGGKGELCATKGKLNEDDKAQMKGANLCRAEPANHFTERR